MTRPVPADRAVLLTPGASATRDHHSLVAIEMALAPVPVDRIDLPTRPAPAVAAVRDGAAALARRAAVSVDRVVVGGRSFGGRMCSMAVTGSAPLPALALVAVSYPLHPPGRPERSRREHFPGIRVPCLFVSGTRDAFATPEELDAATSVIPGPVTHLWLDGGDHGLRGRDPDVAAAVAEWVRALP